MLETFDILVIGSGPGGHAAAVWAARHGARVAIIERQGWGGTCTHRGCIPTKALLACSRLELKKLGRMGVRVALIEMVGQILPGEEGEAAALLAQELKNLGVALHTGVRMETIRETGSGVQLLAVPDAPVSETLHVQDLPGAHPPGKGSEDPYGILSA